MNTSKSFFTAYTRPLIGGFVLSLLLIVAALFFVGRYSGISGGQARVQIEIEGQTRVFEGDVVANMTVLEALQASAAAGNISLDYAMDNGGLVLRSSDGNTVNSEPLNFYLNSAPIEAEKLYITTIKPGDVIAVISK